LIHDTASAFGRAHNDFSDAHWGKGHIRETVMKRLITVATALFSAVLGLAGADALAQRGDGGGNAGAVRLHGSGNPARHVGGGNPRGGHNHGGHYSRWHGGAYWAWPWIAAWPLYHWGFGYPYYGHYGYYGPYAAYPPYEPAPSVYVELDPAGGAPSAAPAPKVLWYYCNEPAGYYPYVQECNSPWVKVLPPPASSTAQAVK
jgi:hypothetical protein